MKKSDEINILNCILCIFVVFVHVSFEAVSEYMIGSALRNIFWVATRLISFVVPGFIVLSGMKFFMSKKEESYLSFILKRFKKIYVPYIIVALIYYFYLIYRGFMIYDLSELLPKIIWGEIASPFYFICIIFQFYLLMPLWKKTLNKDNAKYILVLAFFINIIAYAILKFIYIPESMSLLIFISKNKDRIFIFYLFYWILGGFLGLYHEEFNLFIIKNKFKIIFSYIFVSVLYIYISFNYILKWDFVNHIIFCTVSVIFFYAMSLFLSNIIKHKCFINYFNKISFSIYLIHCLIIYMVDQKLYLEGIESISRRFLIRFFYTYLISILVSIIYERIKHLILSIKNIDSKEIMKTGLK